MNSSNDKSAQSFSASLLLLLLLLLLLQLPPLLLRFERRDNKLPAAFRYTLDHQHRDKKTAQVTPNNNAACRVQSEWGHEINLGFGMHFLRKSFQWIKSERGTPENKKRWEANDPRLVALNLTNKLCIHLSGSFWWKRGGKVRVRWWWWRPPVAALWSITHVGKLNITKIPFGSVQRPIYFGKAPRKLVEKVKIIDIAHD